MTQSEIKRFEISKNNGLGKTTTDIFEGTKLEVYRTYLDGDGIHFIDTAANVYKELKVIVKSLAKSNDNDMALDLWANRLTKIIMFNQDNGPESIVIMSDRLKDVCKAEDYPSDFTITEKPAPTKKLRVKP